LIAAIPQAEWVLADGLLWPGLGEVRDAVCGAHPVAVLVHSLLDKEGSGDAQRLACLEMDALREADGWIATSPATARLVRERLGAEGPPGSVVCPGTASAPRAEGSGGQRLLCVATLTPRKGIRLLLEALALLKGRPWTLDVVGSMQRDPLHAAQVQADIGLHGLEGRVQLHGEILDDALERAYQQADVLVHAAHFEAFGMGLAEAIGRGIPVVSTPAGALEILPKGAVLEVEAGDASGLAAAIDSLLVDDSLRRQMASCAASAKLAGWEESARDFETALTEFM